jgi:FkbM family methyltransferase
MKIKNGQPVKLFNPGFTTIENEIFWNGIENGWEKESIKQWLYYAKNAEGIVDIGANSGIYSILAHSVNPRANILAFEPVERTFDLLLKNVDLNTPNNISTYQLAVSNKNGTSLFYDVLSESQYSASLERSMLSDSIEKVSYEVDVVKLVL